MGGSMENLKKLRKESKLTQLEFSKKFNLSLRGYQDIENDINQTSYENLIKFADFFHCSVDYLLGRQFNETPAQQNLVQIVRTLDDDLCDLAEAYIEGLKATQQQRDRIRERAMRASSSSQEE